MWLLIKALLWSKPVSDEKTKIQPLVIRPKEQIKKSAIKSTSIRVPLELLDRIDKLAEESGHSRNALMVMFLSYGLQHHVK